MRLIVMFDLPNNTKKELKEYTVFRRFLLNNGFYMIQYSIYAKLCANHDVLAINQKKLEQNLPQYGNVRSLAITEKQYAEIKILVGNKSYQEELVSPSPLLVL